MNNKEETTKNNIPSNNGENTENVRDAKGRFTKGNTEGKGRPLGTQNFKTKWLKAIDKLAEANDLSSDEIEEQLILVGYKKAKKGDYNFYKDIFDRIYGKAINRNELTGKDGGDIEINNGTYEQVKGITDNLDDILKLSGTDGSSSKEDKGGAK